MRVTIIKEDGVVGVDGEFRRVDCSALPADFHALQWDGAQGEIEYVSAGRHKKPNELISDLAPYHPYLDAWHAAGS